MMLMPLLAAGVDGSERTANNICRDNQEGHFFNAKLSGPHIPSKSMTETQRQFRN